MPLGMPVTSLGEDETVLVDVNEEEEELRNEGKVTKSPDNWVEKVKRSHQEAEHVHE